MIVLLDGFIFFCLGALGLNEKFTQLTFLESQTYYWVAFVHKIIWMKLFVVKMAKHHGDLQTNFKV